MIFELSDTQRMLSHAAQKLCAPDNAGRPNGQNARARWATYVELGWTRIGLPEQRGGVGGTLADAAAIVFEMGRGGIFDSFADTMAIASAIASIDLTAAGEELLANVASGNVELLPTAEGIDVSPVVTPGGAPRSVGIEFNMVGTPEILARPLESARLTKVATIAGGDSFLLHADSAAVVLASGDAARLGWERAGRMIKQLACIQVIAAARQLLEMATEYARIRVQFDHPIGSYQAVQHQLVDVMSGLDGAELLAFKSLDQQYDHQIAGELLAGFAMTRDAVWNAVMATYNILGGVGFMEEHPLNGYMRKILPAMEKLGQSAALHSEIADTVVSGHWCAD